METQPHGVTAHGSPADSQQSSRPPTGISCQPRESLWMFSLAKPSDERPQGKAA